ncbi:MAG TPA: VTT domain-containing protein [Acidimicrobiales bacterium]|jgi:membrane protein DedA with SNARE-associated domain|nr:VTT domain-containing protein [Acidimicrobiales bacterium]
MPVATRSPAQAKHLLLGLAGLRVGLGVLALPLAPFLYQRHFVVLALMRPSQGVIMAGAFLARQHKVWLPSVLAAAVPLQVLAIWLYFALGRTWNKEIGGRAELPFLAARLLRRDQLKRLRKVLERKGARFVFLARFAIIPTGMVSAAVGASDLDPKRYLLADLAGLFLSTAASVGVGYGLGIAYGGVRPWVVAVGVAGLLALSGTLTWLLQRD